MTRIDDEEAEWFEQRDLDELDYYNGYCAFMEGGSGQWSESRAWREGWETAKASVEFRCSQPSP